MKIRRRPALMQLLSVKSMIRYGPPKYTAGLARSLVSGNSRSPAPPARRMTRMSSRLMGRTAILARASRQPGLSNRAEVGVFLQISRFDLPVLDAYDQAIRILEFFLERPHADSSGPGPVPGHSSRGRRLASSCPA